MKSALIVAACTVALASVGACLGMIINGRSLGALDPATTGAFGGLGIGCALLDIARRYRNAVAV